MQSNETCMRTILKYIDENTGVKIDEMDNTISLRSTELYTVVNNLSKNGEYKPEEVAYNTLLCEKFGYINCRFERNSNGNSFVMGKCPITDITPEGEQFLMKEK